MSMRPIKLLSIFGEDKTKSGMLGHGVSNANTQSDEDPNFGDYIRGATLADADEQHKPGTWWDTPSGLIAARDRKNNTDYFDNEDEARAFALGGINTTPPPGGDEEEVPDSGEEPAAPPVMQPQTALGKHLQPGQSPQAIPQDFNAPEHEMKPGTMIQDPKSGMWKTKDKYGNFDYFETPEDAQNYLQGMSADDELQDYDPSNPKFWADVPEESINSREDFLMRNMMKDAYPPKNFPYEPNEPKEPDYDPTDDRFWPQDARDDWFDKDESLHEILNLLERNYKREYELYHSRPDQKKRRAQRNKTRRKFERAGKVRKGDGKDIHHRDGNTANLSHNNTVVMDRSKNRAMKERAPINPTPVQEDHIIKDDERLVLLVKQLLIKILKAKAAQSENKELLVRKTLTPQTEGWNKDQWKQAMDRTNKWKKENPALANAKRAAKEKDAPWLRKQKPLPVPPKTEAEHKPGQVRTFSPEELAKDREKFGIPGKRDVTGNWVDSAGNPIPKGQDVVSKRKEWEKKQKEKSQG